VRGEIGIVVVPESQRFAHAQQGDTELYAASVLGAYQGFFQHNIQADWVHLDDIDVYDLLYLPYPVMLPQAAAERLRVWVERGGTLISEGCPGYFDERGHVAPRQPGLGLAELFGAQESYVEFTPDLLGELTFMAHGRWTYGGTFLQAYRPTTGKSAGWYVDGRVAVVDHAYGRGRTRLIGTMPGAGMAAHPDEPAPLFADLLAWAGVAPHVRCSAPGIQARLHQGGGKVFLWVVNPQHGSASADLALGGPWRELRLVGSRWGEEAAWADGEITVTVGARDVAIIEMA